VFARVDHGLTTRCEYGANVTVHAFDFQPLSGSDPAMPIEVLSRDTCGGHR
jgi:hypothetical protein